MAPYDTGMWTLIKLIGLKGGNRTPISLLAAPSQSQMMSRCCAHHHKQPTGRDGLSNFDLTRPRPPCGHAPLRPAEITGRSLSK